jgi:hypothetical protein
MKVKCSRDWRSRRRLRTCACTETSSAETGSSATTRRGLVARARERVAILGETAEKLLAIKPA